MRTFVTRLVLAAITGLVVTPSAQAHDGGSLKHKHDFLRAQVVQQHGKRAPGRDIVRHGVRFKWVSKSGSRRHWAVRDAKPREVAAVIRQLRKLLAPPPRRIRRLVVTTPAPPAQKPAGTASSAVRAPAGGTLAGIRSCESGGNYRAVSPGGTYRGAYQFDYRTWASVGGSGDPAAASPAEQDRRAAMLYAQRGAQPWPVCGR